MSGFDPLDIGSNPVGTFSVYTAILTIIFVLILCDTPVSCLILIDINGLCGGPISTYTVTHHSSAEEHSVVTRQVGGSIPPDEFSVLYAFSKCNEKVIIPASHAGVTRFNSGHLHYRGDSQNC